MNMKKQNRGFTLIELLTVLAVMGVLLAAAAPSFRGMIYSNRQTTAVNTFIRALTITRSEAAKRAVSINLSAEDALDGGALNNANQWGEGWIVWEDKNKNGAYDAGEEISKFFDFPPGVTMQSSLGSVLFRMSPTGRLTLLDNGGNTIATGESLLICDGRTNEKGRKITFSGVGQPSTTEYNCP